MLSYRHSFHAGNHADVLKHSVLCLILDAMISKDKPFVYMDTHAGAGSYRLNTPQAAKTAEYLAGVGALWGKDWPTSALSYHNHLKALNPAGPLRLYPGSPKLAHGYLRAGDRMLLTELHSSDFPRLAELFRKDRKVKVYQENGYQRLKASVPPPERRGLVLIDPSYEVKTEYLEAVGTMIEACKKWATGIYALWYPVVDRREVRLLENKLKSSGIRKILQLELDVLPDTQERGMTGSGMLIINPPWTLLKDMESLFPWLLEGMKQSEQSRWVARWLVQE